jgi:DNA polymerase I-like protein with 3'-5' exonuclease and polymerase domains
MTDLIVSIDWQQIELVLIGEFSGDPAFFEAYGQLPYNDLHLTAACTGLSMIKDYEVTPDDFKALKRGENRFPFPLLDAKGNELAPEKFYGYCRGTALGKGMNFEWPYSGYLANVGERWGLSPQQTMELTNAYNERFAVAAAWRNATIADARFTGYVQLPDGHRRVLYEATPQWRAVMENYFWDLTRGWQPDDAKAIKLFGDMVIRKIQKRAGNQLINALIQGSCATLAKRSILRIMKKAKEMGLHVRFLMPIHDELVFSVPAEEVLIFISMAKAVMADHGDIFKIMKVNSTAAVGRTFQPWDAVKAPYGQIELDEAPKLPWLAPELVGKQLPPDVANDVIRRLAA